MSRLAGRRGGEAGTGRGNRAEVHGRSIALSWNMSYFCLLADPAGYAVSDADLLNDAEARDYWLKLFEDHFVMTLESAKVVYGRSFAAHVASAEAQFAETIAALRADPSSAGPVLGVMEMCRLREKALRDNELHDPFRHIKNRENAAALASYPEVVELATSLPWEQRWERLVRGVFAGNIFDLGSVATLGYAKDRVDFDVAMGEVRRRPWRVDDFDELVRDLPNGQKAARWAKAVIFVDNAGADFILGVMPLARQLAACGVQIILAANEYPSLNDITAEETVDLIGELSAVDDELAGYVGADMFEVVSTGNDIPLIDLSDVSDELNAAADDANLVFLEGMGRTIESNLHTTFTVDSLQLCQLKDPTIADRVGGEVYDCVCMYRPVAPGGAA